MENLKSKIEKMVALLGLDKLKLQEMLNTGITESNINEYGRFDSLQNSVDKEKAKAYFEALEGCKIPSFKVNMKVYNLLKEFIMKGGYEV